MTLVLCFSEIGKSHMDLIYISNFPSDAWNTTNKSYAKSNIHIRSMWNQFQKAKNQAGSIFAQYAHKAQTRKYLLIWKCIHAYVLCFLWPHQCMVFSTLQWHFFFNIAFLFFDIFVSCFDFLHELVIWISHKYLPIQSNSFKSKSLKAIAFIACVVTCICLQKLYAIPNFVLILCRILLLLKMSPCQCPQIDYTYNKIGQ